MKRRNYLLVAFILVFSMLLTACGAGDADGGSSGNADETIQTAETKAEVRDMVNAFYEGVLTADPVSMTSSYNGEQGTVFTKDGDKVYLRDDTNDITYYMFVEDGTKYFIGDGETAYEDELMYDFMANTIETTLAIYVTGIVNSEDDEADEALTYSATKTDRTVDGGAESELVYVITGSQDGQTVTLTVSGKALADGRVSEVSYRAESGEETYEVGLKFEYDGVSVELPEYTIEGSTAREYDYVESPYKTFQELIDTLDEDEQLYYSFIDNTLYAAGEKDGRYYQFSAEVSSEERAAYDALDFFSDDYEEQVYGIIGKIAIEDCVDFTDGIMPQDELDSFVGKTVADIIDAGFESSGWSIFEDEAYLFFSKDLMGYKAKVTISDGFDVESDFEFEDMYGFAVEQFDFDSPETLPIQ